jgi:hypothetical protein
MRVYLAGPMSGIDKQNFPAFDAAAKFLRASGLQIVSPAELDSPAERKRALTNRPATKTWGAFLARDIEIVADQCDGIIFLPGWEKSRGARLEAFTALLCGKTEFGWYHPDMACKVSWMPASYLRHLLMSNMP